MPPSGPSVVEREARRPEQFPPRDSADGAAASPNDVHRAETTESAPPPGCGLVPAADGRGGPPAPARPRRGAPPLSGGPPGGDVGARTTPGVGDARPARPPADTNSAAHASRHLPPRPAPPPVRPDPPQWMGVGLPGAPPGPPRPARRPSRRRSLRLAVGCRTTCRDPARAGATQDPSPSRTWAPGATSTSAPTRDLVASRDSVRPPSARATARPLDAFNAW